MVFHLEVATVSKEVPPINCNSPNTTEDNPIIKYMDIWNINLLADSIPNQLAATMLVEHQGFLNIEEGEEDTSSSMLGLKIPPCIVLLVLDSASSF